MIHRGKLQAIYNYLPGMWVSLKNEKGQPLVALITAWNHRPMKNIYASFIEKEIRHRLRVFAERGGDISLFPIDREHVFSFEEIEGNEEIGDIFGQLSPLLFYCDNCGAIEQFQSAKDVRLGGRCKKCGKGSLKQLQFVYTCSCGHAEPIQVNKNKENTFYHPGKNQYVMFRRVDNIEKKIELNTTCKNCGNVLTVDNASSKRNFKQQSVTVINLVEDSTGKFYDKGELAHKTVLARWFDKVSSEEYKSILADLDNSFREIQADFSVESALQSIIAVMPGLDPLTYSKLKEQLIGDQAGKSREIDKYAASCDEVFEETKFKLGDKYSEWISHLAFKLVQYYTIRDSNRIELNDCMSDMQKFGVIDSCDEILSLHKQLGIRDMMVTNDIELVTCVYGYTRKTEDPSNNNIKGRLKLNSFGVAGDGTLISYGVKLNTEGILFDIDQRKIIDWLLINKIIDEAKLPDMDSDESVKRWYITNVHSDNVTTFGNMVPSDRITDAVFGLLHSMSHSFLNAAGENSGLDKNSLAELIIIETASIFIYSQSEQGLTLGALSSMANLGYKKFLNDVYVNSRNCIFDPICLEADSCCSACQLIPEISCKYFNHNLGRKYLYSYSIEQFPSIGFWDMKWL